MKKYFAKEDGQGIVEYGLIVALVAIVSVSSLGFLSGGLTDKFAGLDNALETEQATPLTPLGDNFAEISQGMIDRIIDKFQSSGKYGLTWSDRTYTDLGLNPEDWNNPVEHIYYSPSGAKLNIRPEDGYSFIVNGIDGKKKTLPASYHWNLTYNDLDKTWYYHTIAPENKIDINTLTTVKNN
jgi:pilus assembly protein Flp/PilA